jgi:hypothetical protein
MLEPDGTQERVKTFFSCLAVSLFVCQERDSEAEDIFCFLRHASKDLVKLKHVAAAVLKPLRRSPN